MTIAERLSAYNRQLDHAHVISLDESALMEEFRTILTFGIYREGNQNMRTELVSGNYRVLVTEAISRGLIGEFAKIEEEYRKSIEWRIKAFGSQV